MTNLKKEQWLPVVGFEGLYEVSNLGRMKSLAPTDKKTVRVDKIIKGGLSKTGYIYVQLRRDKVTIVLSIHTLVAEAFLNYKREKGVICVDHITGDKLDNSLSNLQVLTHRENLTKDRTNQHGYTGVNKDSKTGKYNAMIVLNGKLTYLACYSTPKEASDRYQKELKNIV